MFRYSTLEEKKTVFPCVLNLYNLVEDATVNEYVKLCNIENDENVIQNEDFIEPITNAINEVVNYMNNHFRAKFLNIAYVEYHDYIGDNVENFIGKNSSNQLDSYIFSFYFYINNDYEGGEMVIYNKNTDEDDEENIDKILEVKSSSDQFLKIICLNPSTIYLEKPSSGNKKCIVFHVRYN